MQSFGQHLLGQEGHIIQLLCPIFRNSNGLILLVHSLNRESLLVCMSNELLQVLRLQRVEHVEKVITRWTFACCVLAWEIRHKLTIFTHLRIDGLHRQLFVLGDGDELDLALFEELLFAFEHHLEEVFVYNCFIRQQVLEMLIKTIWRLDRKYEKTYYTMKSYLERNLNAKSLAAIWLIVLFFDAICCSASILNQILIIAHSAPLVNEKEAASN